MAQRALGDIADIVRGISFPKEAKSLEPRPGDVACLRTTNVQRQVEWDDLWFVPAEHVKREEQYVRPGDILISTANSYELVGKVALVTGTPRHATLGAFISLIRARDDVDPKFLYHQLAWGRTQSRIRETASTTTNISNVSTKKLAALELEVSTLEEQHRIVAEIEKHLSRLDEAVANLKRVKAKLKRYKAAILKAAVAGRLVLTEAELARREGRGYETGAQLLQYVLKSRRAALRGKWIEPDPPDTTDLPKLPIGWEWASIDQIAADTQIGLDRRRESQNEEHRGSPYVKMNNVNLDGDVSWDGLVYVEASANEQQRFGVRDGDLLFNTRNSTELVGKIGLVLSPPERAIYNNNLMRIRVASGVLSAFVCAQMCSMGFRARMEKIKRATTNVAAVYAKDLLPLAIAVPPTAEQLRVVAELDRRLSIVREVEHEVDANLRRAERCGRLRFKRLSRARHSRDNRYRRTEL